MGMATATYHASRSSASARVQLFADGTVKVFSAAHDLGTGTYTIFAQTAADALGVPFEKISVELGDSKFPPAPPSSASQTTASVGPAIIEACAMLRQNLMRLAVADSKSKLNGANEEEIEYAAAKFYVRGR